MSAQLRIIRPHRFRRPPRPASTTAPVDRQSTLLALTRLTTSLMTLTEPAQLIEQMTSGPVERRREGVQRFLNLLRAGGSDYPMTLLKQAGVDLGTPGPAEAVVAQLDRRVSQLEAEIDKLEK